MAGTPCPEVASVLPGQNWEFLLRKTILWYWRGSLGGVLPDGFDPNSLAAEALAEFLQICAPPAQANCRRHGNQGRYYDAGGSQYDAGGSQRADAIEQC